MTTTNTAGSAIDAEYIVKQIKNTKDTLANVMRLANLAIDQNAEVDLGTKTTEVSNNKLEKSLEDFYIACDQLQLFLGLMSESATQTRNRGRYTPKPICSSKTENLTGTQTYTEYLSTVRTQIAATKELHELLSDFCYTQLP
ncbi:mediator of RNA polymerase II transcription subunit 29-like [Stylophora pistillata]|uniref:mediator of RNA polymerase II transcription subunit 29-like n=1 Tax=Stylophora pistillata TaxID=50429 RepID=UPI000C04CF71|nr:mediator of RNA polymerase II transcription subunit 29-like [Stylophora pistillata]